MFIQTYKQKVENIITNINLDSSSESDNELDYE